MNGRGGGAPRRAALRLAGLPVLLACFLCAANAGADEGTWALVGAAVIDGTGRPPLEDAVVLIHGDLIAAVGPRRAVAVPKGARVVDVAGAFVIPGLMDSNVHLVMRPGRPDAFDRYEDLIEEAAQTALRAGVTSVFDTWGPRRPLQAVRDRIARGEIPGSRIFVAGHCIGAEPPIRSGSPGTGPLPPEVVARVNELSVENVGEELRYMTPEQVRAEVKAYAARGLDFLKYASSGHDRPDVIVFSEAVQRAIVEEAHRAGLMVQAHTTTVESLRLAVEAGVDLITHADVTGPVPIPPDTIAALAARRIPCGFFPKTDRRWGIEMKKGSETPGAKPLRVLETMRANQRALRNGGVRLLLGTDGGLWPADLLAAHPPEHWTDYEAVIGEGFYVRCQGMADMGFPPHEIILAGTRNVAAAYGLSDRLGTIEPGKLADLIVLEADPLRDIANLRRIRLVIKGGRAVERDALPLRRILFPGFYRPGPPGDGGEPPGPRS